MPILSSKLHYLNRKTHVVSQVCTERLWPGRRGDGNMVTLSIVERAKFIELEQLLAEIREACKEDKGL